MKLKPEDYQYRRNSNAVSSINYHFIFVPKRRKSVLVNGVDRRLQEIVFDLVKEHNWKLMAIETMPDHVHILLNAPPSESPAQIARWIKGRAAHHLRAEFPRLKKLPCLWSPSYFCATTGQVSTETIQRYIENQKGK